MQPPDDLKVLTFTTKVFGRIAAAMGLELPEGQSGLPEGETSAQLQTPGGEWRYMAIVSDDIDYWTQQLTLAAGSYAATLTVDGSYGAVELNLWVNHPQSAEEPDEQPIAVNFECRAAPGGTYMWAYHCIPPEYSRPEADLAIAQEAYEDYGQRLQDFLG